MRDVVKFNGRPEEVVLEYSTGKEGQGDHGPYFIYTLAENKIMFATPTLDAKIQEMRPRKGERLQIQLLKNNQWSVLRVDPPAGGPEVAAPVHQQAGPIQQQTPLQQRQDTTPHPVPAAPLLMTGESQQMLSQFIAVYEVLTALEKYSALKGRPVQFTSEDFRAAAISAYIGQQRGGR